MKTRLGLDLDKYDHVFINRGDGVLKCKDCQLQVAISELNESDKSRLILWDSTICYFCDGTGNRGHPDNPQKCNVCNGVGEVYSST